MDGSDVMSLLGLPLTLKILVGGYLASNLEKFEGNPIGLIHSLRGFSSEVKVPLPVQESQCGPPHAPIHFAELHHGSHTLKMANTTKKLAMSDIYRHVIMLLVSETGEAQKVFECCRDFVRSLSHQLWTARTLHVSEFEVVIPNVDEIIWSRSCDLGDFLNSIQEVIPPSGDKKKVNMVLSQSPLDPKETRVLKSLLELSWHTTELHNGQTTFARSVDETLGHFMTSVRELASLLAVLSSKQSGSTHKVVFYRGSARLLSSLPQQQNTPLNSMSEISTSRINQGSTA